MKKKNRLGIIKKQKLNTKVKVKAAELQEEGYKKVVPSSLWDYIIAYRWKREFPKTISEMKIDIESITANDYFDYQVICAQTVKSHEFDWDKIKDLLD
ncbi:hypothetical protein G7081_01670 [Vagococcus coleopterorum]|uniref:Post-transcriptional regulator n=1 Tax=Vagococcus coleopterorum TaxID=2714946 RepID=A0A6G8ALE4_9ENTE|nr:post-transcriptional regulator [Vagococcus coleopterorum]QIL45891.1 hypothetical protein G7081_01670 [Vagococcus coleopterorum]